MGNNRDDFTEATKKLLRDRVGGNCSNPGCKHTTSGPARDPKRAINMGTAAHICAAAKGGPRYDENMTPEERKSPDNGIWLCNFCSDLIDKDPDEYTVEKLHEWKKQAEENARIILHKMPEEADKTSASDTPVIETIDDSHRSKKQFTIDISVDDNRKIINESELKRNLLLFMSLEEEMDIQVNVESSQGTAFTELYERIQNKLNNGEALTEAEEKNFKDIIRGKRRNEVINKRHKIACELFLGDTKVQNVYCSELKDYLFILSEIVGYDPALLGSPNYLENAGICFKLMQSNKREFHFIAYIPRKTLKNMGMSAETWTGEIMLKDIYSFDYATVKRILVYFYLDLAWEAIQRDPDILTDKRALNIGNYMPFPN